MNNHGNDVPEKLTDLAKYFDQKYDDASVLIDNAPSNEYNTLLITVSGDDQDAVAELATQTIATEARNHAITKELGGQETVSPMTLNDDSSFYEYEVAVRFYQ